MFRILTFGRSLRNTLFLSKWSKMDFPSFFTNQFILKIVTQNPASSVTVSLLSAAATPPTTLSPLVNRNRCAHCLVSIYSKLVAQHKLLCSLVVEPVDFFHNLWVQQIWSCHHLCCTILEVQSFFLDDYIG